MAKRTLSLRVSDDMYEKIADYAAECDLTTTQALTHLLNTGLDFAWSLDKTKRELKELVEENKKTSQEQINTFKEVLHEFGIARKNIGKATQASFGSFSMISWLYHDYLVDRAINLSEDTINTPVGQRITHWAKSPVSDLFDFYLSSGGALQRDPKMKYYPSFKTALSSQQFRNSSIEELVGNHAEIWDSLSEQTNEVEALRYVNNKHSKRKDN